MIIFIGALILGIIFMVRGYIIIRNYPGYLEIAKAARHAARVPYFIGFALVAGAYISAYFKK